VGDSDNSEEAEIGGDESPASSHSHKKKAQKKSTVAKNAKWEKAFDSNGEET